jgi:cation diffusion facilitator CzcD-associated flavoprotein CzcO
MTATVGAGEHWDVAVIGAGLSGMYQLLKLRQLGFKARVYEAGGDVGGTWYWNRYPGCRFDSESWSYVFSFSPEVLNEWSWAEHFSGQPENLRYCRFLADKFQLRRDITFNARVKSASWDDAANEWELVFEGGSRSRARFPASATSKARPIIPACGRIMR